MLNLKSDQPTVNKLIMVETLLSIYKMMGYIVQVVSEIPVQARAELCQAQPCPDNYRYFDITTSSAGSATQVELD